MIQLFMSRSGSSVIVPLNLPASHGAMTEAYSQLEQANRTGKTEIVEIKSVIANLPSYLGGLDPDSRTQLAQLNLLSSIIAKMDSRERSIYAGALDGNSINDLNDMIRVAEQVSDYILIPNVNSDVTLGRYVAVAGQIQGDPRFPEAAWPYLDFAKIGAEYYAEHGGAYTHAGYVLLKQDAEPVREKAAKIRLDLSSSQAQASVSLPALKEELERVKKLLGIDCFAEAAIGQDLMPTEERGSIGSVKPSGWHTVRYNGVVDGNYLYNRCHLIGFQLSGENANERNLITGTRYLNIDGMLPFENMVADYVQETNNHVLYRVTPVFEGDNLLAAGVLMEGYSVEDDGDGICFCIFAYNVQPGVTINYATGDSALDGVASTSGSDPSVVQEPSSDTQAGTSTVEAHYVLNNNTKKFHLPSCSSADDIKASNKEEYYGSRDELISMGYDACKRCNP
jgi:Adenosine deaminase